jgi:putative Ca2+/H+ antiporter (TMEM165/GDT1 family)
MDVRFFLTVFSTVFLAELGDKTQLATFLYASEGAHSKLTVFLAAASALVVTSAIGTALGAQVSQLVEPRTISRLAGLGFILIGLWTLLRA